MKKRITVIITLILALAVGGLVVYEIFFVKDYPLRYKDEILLYADTYSVPADLVCAVINVESGYDPDAESSAGAVGLMQILPNTAEEIAWRLDIEAYNLLDPATNIRFGTYYLSYLYGVFGNWETAAAAYNAGIGNVTNWLSDLEYSADGITLIKIPFTETASYVRRISTGRKAYVKKLE